MHHQPSTQLYWGWGAQKGPASFTEESPKPSRWGQGRICPKLHPGTRGPYGCGRPLLGSAHTRGHPHRPRGCHTPRWSGSAGQPLTNPRKRNRRGSGGAGGAEESSLRRAGRPDPPDTCVGSPSCSVVPGALHPTAQGKQTDVLVASPSLGPALPTRPCPRLTPAQGRWPS